MKSLDSHKIYKRRSTKCNRIVSCWCRNWPYILLVFSLVGLGLIGVIKFIALDWIVDQQVAQKLQLVPGSDTFEKWQNVPVPIIIKFKLFNVTNPIEVQNGEIPILQETGPYAYQEKRVKDIISMDTERDVIFYKQRIFYTFRPDLSNGSEYDRLIIINVPFVTFAKLTYDNVGNFSFAHQLVDRVLRQRGERLFTFATVKEYIFDGYAVQHYINFLSSPALALIGGVKIPKSIATGRFGFYLGKNGSDDGEYVIRTGRTNVQEFGQIVSWNGKTKLDYYNGPACNLINGTDGSLVSPFLTKESKVRFYSSDICRSIYAIFKEDTQVKGIDTYRFKPPNTTVVFNHKDFCFCPTGKNNECFKQGVLSMAPCRGGAPIAMSAPHFLDAHETYKEGIDGLNPDREIHETFLDIEPKTGLVLRASKRLQFNVMVHQNKDMSTFANVRSTMFPFMWVEESVEATDDYIEDLKNQLFRPVAMAQTSTSIGFVSCAILLLLGSLGWLSICLSPSRYSTRSITSDNSNSFHHDTTSSRGSTSRSGSPASVRSEGSSTTRAHSVGTMTTNRENRGTMTESNSAIKPSAPNSQPNQIFTITT